jgi:general secretion pathway protein D
MLRAVVPLNSSALPSGNEQRWARSAIASACLSLTLALAPIVPAWAQGLPANPFAPAPSADGQGGAPAMFQTIQAAKQQQVEAAAAAKSPAAKHPAAAAPAPAAGKPAAAAQPAAKAEEPVSKGKKGKAAKAKAGAAPVAPVAAPAAEAPKLEEAAAAEKAAAAASAPAPAEESRAAAVGLKVRRPSEVNDAPIAGVTLKFDNADVYEVVQAVLGDILHLNYLVDPAITGKITLNTNGTVSSADVYSILESVLQLNSLSIIRDNKLYKIVRDPTAPKDSIGFEAAGENSPMIEIIPMKFVQASALLNVLKNFIGPQAGIVNDTTNRYLIIADRAANIAKLKEMIKTLDVDYLQKVRIRVIPILKGDAVEMAKEMDQLFKTSGMFNWPGTEGNKVFFMPVVRMNSLLVAGANDAVLDTAEMWIKKLDDEPKDGVGAGIHVHPIVNSNALHVANILRQIYGGGPIASSSTTSPSTGAASQTIVRGNVPTPAPATAAAAVGAGLSGAVQIIPDEATNTLVIKANQQDYLQIKKVIDRIDTIPRQVLIQVMVAEVTLTDKLQYGVEWWLKSQPFSYGGKTWSGQAALNSGLTVPSTTTGNPLTSSATAGFNYGIFSGSDLVGLLQLLSTNTDVTVISAPHVMASDGKTARIEVGSEVPIITQVLSTPTSTTGTLTTSNSVQYKPTGIILEVKPSINESGLVTLQVSQEVSSVNDAAVNVGGSNYPSFTKRKVETNVTLEEGRTLMIAGLIQDLGNKNSSGLPGLKDIPVLGTLFGAKTDSKTKNELVITITPYIVRNRNEGDKLTNAFQDGVQQIKEMVKKSSASNFPEKSELAAQERARIAAERASDVRFETHGEAGVGK